MSAKEEKTPFEKFRRVVLMAIGILALVVILAIVGGTLLGMGVEQLNIVANTVGSSFNNLSIGLRNLGNGVSRSTMALVTVLVTPVIFFLIAKALKDEIAGEKAEDHPKHEAKHP